MTTRCCTGGKRISYFGDRIGCVVRDLATVTQSKGSLDGDRELGFAVHRECDDGSAWNSAHSREDIAQPWVWLRTASTLVHDRVWYPVNRAFGWVLVGNAGVICGLGMLRWLGVEVQFLLGLVALMLVPTSGCGVIAYKAKKMKEALDQNGDA